MLVDASVLTVGYDEDLASFHPDDDDWILVPSARHCPAPQCSRKSLAKRDLVSTLVTCVDDSGTMLDTSLLWIRVTQKFKWTLVTLVSFDLIAPQASGHTATDHRYYVTAAGFESWRLVLSACRIDTHLWLNYTKYFQ